MIDEQLRRLPASWVLALRAQVELISTLTGGRFSLGTGCSGTDLVATVFRMLDSRFRSMFGVSLEVSLDVSCEIVAFKRDWIQQYSKPKQLFEDLQQLPALNVVNVHSDAVPIPILHVWACGIECDSISALNVHSAANLQCVDDASTDTRTGSTARACLAFVRARLVGNLRAYVERRSAFCYFGLSRDFPQSVLPCHFWIANLANV